MKKVFFALFVVVTAGFWSYAQDVTTTALESISYQTDARNTSNALVLNQSEGIKINILQSSATGTAVHFNPPLTNGNSLATL